MARRTPLYDAHRAAAARMVEFAGWEMPVQYKGVIEEHTAVRERVGIFDVSHMGQLAIQGPRAAALVDSLCQPKVADLGYYHFRAATVAGIAGCIVARTGYTGEDGFEVFLPPQHARKLWDTLLERGAQPCGLGARDSLRLEVAYRLYGND